MCVCVSVCVCVCVRAHLFEFVRFIQIRDLSTGENVIDVFQKGLLHDLRVSEEKHGGLVLNPRLVVQLPNICTLVSGEAGEEAEEGAGRGREVCEYM